MLPRCLKNKCSNGCRNRHGQEHLFWTTTSKIHQNGAQNPPKLVPKSSKIGPKIHQNCSKNRLLGVSWGCLVASCFLFPFFLPFSPLWAASWSELGRQVGPKLGQVGSKLGQVGAKMRHVGAKLAQVGAKVAQVGTKMDPTWASRGFFFVFRDVQICIDF